MLCYFQVYLSDDSLSSSSSKPSIQLFLLYASLGRLGHLAGALVVTSPHLRPFFTHSQRDAGECESHHDSDPSSLSLPHMESSQSPSRGPQGRFPQHPSFSPLLPAPVLPSCASCCSTMPNTLLPQGFCTSGHCLKNFSSYFLADSQSHQVSTQIVLSDSHPQAIISKTARTYTPCHPPLPLFLNFYTSYQYLTYYAFTYLLSLFQQ